MVSEKERYIQFANGNKDICIYNKPYWLDAVCGADNWNAVVIEDNDEIIAAVPYYQKKRYGIRYITQPQLTQNFDIWFKPYTGNKKEKKIEYEFDILEKVADKFLNIDADYYIQTFSPQLINWEPFYWKGFQQETRYTFIIKKGEDYKTVLENMSSNLKRDIKQAAKRAKIIDIDNIELFYKYNCMSFSRQGINNPISIELIKRLYNACKINGACKMVAAIDDTDIHCVGFYSFDNNYVYEIMLGTDPEKRRFNFKTYMTSEMIKFACDTGRGFDFEGSMIKQIANYNRRFGSDIVPYFKLWKVKTTNVVKKAALWSKGVRF